MDIDYKANGRLIDSRTGKRIGFSCICFRDRSIKYFLDAQLKELNSNVYFRGERAYLKGDELVKSLKEIKLKLCRVDNNIFYEYKSGVYKAFQPLYIDSLDIWMLYPEHEGMKTLIRYSDSSYKSGYLYYILNNDIGEKEFDDIRNRYNYTYFETAHNMGDF